MLFEISLRGGQPRTETGRKTQPDFMAAGRDGAGGRNSRKEENMIFR